MERKVYMQNWYINKKNYIMGLDKRKIEGGTLSDFEQYDLDKWISKFRPVGTRYKSKRSGIPYSRGDKVIGLSIRRENTLVSFD